MPTVEEAAQRENELRARLTALHAEREKVLLSAKPDENKLRNLRKQINEAKEAVEDAETIRRAAEREAARKLREVSAAERRQRLKAAGESIAAEQDAARGLQLAIEKMATAYQAVLDATTARRAAFRVAKLRDLAPGSVDVMAAREFARLGIQHLSHLNLTGVAREPNIPASFARNGERLRALLAAAAEASKSDVAA